MEGALNLYEIDNLRVQQEAQKTRKLARWPYLLLPWRSGQYTGRSCGRERSSVPPTPTSQPVLFLPSSRGYRCLPEGIPAGILHR